MKKLIAVLAAFSALALVYVLTVDDKLAEPVETSVPVQPADTAAELPGNDSGSPAPFAEPRPDVGADVDSETEIVMGIRVRKDRKCTLKKHFLPQDDGTVTEAFTCEPDNPIVNPWDNHSDAELLVLSYADAGAAEELGKRLLFQDKFGPAHDMMLRAVALEPEETGPLRYIINTEGSLRGDSKEAINAVATAYIVTKTASYFDETLTTAWVEPDLTAYGFTSKDIAKLDEHVERNLERMREVQIEVFGQSMIGEDL